MSYLVGNPKDRFSRDEAQTIQAVVNSDLKKTGSVKMIKNRDTLDKLFLYMQLLAHLSRRLTR